MNTSTFTQVARILGITALVGAVVFVIGVVAAGFTYPGYSHVRQMISELGGVEATHPWIQNTGFMVFGLSVIALAIGLMIDAGRAFAAAILLGALGAFGLVAEGIAHCDAGCEGQTAEGAVHLGFGLLGFVCGIVAIFLFARRWRRDARWSARARFARWSGWLAVATFVAFFASDATPSVSGLAQRAFALVLLVFVVVTALWLARMPYPTETEIARTDPARADAAG